jgi:hypothetical protein
LSLPKLTLFIVPCAQAIAPSAPNRQFGHRLAHLDVAGDDGGRIFRRQHGALRMTMLIGRRHPAFIGMSSSTITRNT